MIEELALWTRKDWQTFLFLFHVSCMVYVTIRENWKVLIIPGPIASFRFLRDLILNFINPFTIIVAAILLYRDLILLWGLIKGIFIDPVRWLFRYFRKARQPKQLLVILCLTFFVPNVRAQISPTEVINIINSLSSGLNQLEIFASMDESLKTLEDAQKTMESLKAAEDWFGKMEHVGTMLMLAENVSCNAQNLNHVYSMYLGSDWKDWNQGKECLISYDYQLIILKAQTVSEIIRELITSNDLDPGQRDMLSLQLQETMDKMNKAINDMHEQLKGQQEYADWLSYKEKNISLASDIMIERYQGTGEIARELVGNDAKSIFSTIIILCLAAGLPAVIYASATGSQNAPQMMIAWVVALIIYTIANQIVN